jgi:hypothetical protein
MLRFFRRLRYKLLDEGNLSKYSYYAIGEIVLVVIGILIALQINNWNQENKTRAEETILRANLVESVRQLGVMADSFIEAEQSNIKVLEATLQNWDSLSFEEIDNAFRPFQNRNFSALFNLTGYSHFFDPERDVYNTAISDGSIAIIQDARFLARMDRLYNYVVPRVDELMMEEYALNRAIQAHVSVRYASIFLKNTIVDSTLDVPDVWTDDTYKALFAEMRSDGVLKYMLSQRIELKRSRLLIVEQAKDFVRILTMD